MVRASGKRKDREMTSLTKPQEAPEQEMETKLQESQPMLPKSTEEITTESDPPKRQEPKPSEIQPAPLMSETRMEPLPVSKKAEEEEEDMCQLETVPVEYPTARYFILLLVAALNFSNTFCWIAYAPIQNYVNAFYGEDSASWFSLIYMFVSIPLGTVGMYAGSRLGFYGPFCFAFTVNGLGSLVRGLSSLESTNVGMRFTLCMVGQGISASAYPVIMYLPSQVASIWFPEKERYTATMFGVLANPFGVLMANAITPTIVTSSHRIWALNESTVVFCFILAVVALLYVFKYSEPSLPGDQKTLNFAMSLQMLLLNKDFIFLMISMGGGIGMFNAFYTTLSSMMCPAGYNNTTSAMCAATMIIAGLTVSPFASRFVERKGYDRLVLNVAMLGAVISGVALLWVMVKPDLTYWLFALSATFGLFGLSAYPIGLGLAVEYSFPAAPEVCSGLIVLFGQVFGVIFVLIIKFLSEPFNEFDLVNSIDACRVNDMDSINVPANYSLPNVIITITSFFILVFNLFISNMEDLEERKILASIENDAKRASLQTTKFC